MSFNSVNICCCLSPGSCRSETCSWSCRRTRDGQTDRQQLLCWTESKNKGRRVCHRSAAARTWTTSHLIEPHQLSTNHAPTDSSGPTGRKTASPEEFDAFLNFVSDLVLCLQWSSVHRSTASVTSPLDHSTKVLILPQKNQHFCQSCKFVHFSVLRQRKFFDSVKFVRFYDKISFLWKSETLQSSQFNNKSLWFLDTKL